MQKFDILSFRLYPICRLELQTTFVPKFCRKWTAVTTEVRILFVIKLCKGSFTLTKTDSYSNLITTLYYAEHRHIAQTGTRIPTRYLCTVQESESVPKSVSGNVKEPLYQRICSYLDSEEFEIILKLVTLKVNSVRSVTGGPWVSAPMRCCSVKLPSPTRRDPWWLRTPTSWVSR